jgi:hypothetical protein
MSAPHSTHQHDLRTGRLLTASMPVDSSVKLDAEQLIQIKAPQHQRSFILGHHQCRRNVMSPIERACTTDEPMGLPSPEALQVATDVIRRRYVLPETMGCPEVRFECMRLAYLVMAYGLAPSTTVIDTEAAPMNP